MSWALESQPCSAWYGPEIEETGRIFQCGLWRISDYEIQKSNDSIWLSNQQQKTTKFGKIVKHLLFTFPFLQNNHCQNCHIPKKATKGSMREKCQNTEFFLAHIFPHSDWIRRDTEHLSVFSPNTGKYGPEKNPYFDTFHAVVWKSKSSRFDMKVTLIYWMIAVHCFQFQNITLSSFLNGTVLLMKVTLNMKFEEFFNSFFVLLVNSDVIRVYDFRNKHFVFHFGLISTGFCVADFFFNDWNFITYFFQLPPFLPITCRYIEPYSLLSMLLVKTSFFLQW